MELEPLVSNEKGSDSNSETLPSEYNTAGIISSSGSGEKTGMSSPESEDNEEEDDRLSNAVSFMHFLKGFIATGFLAMPYAVKLVGLWVFNFCWWTATSPRLTIVRIYFDMTGTLGLAVIGWIAGLNVLALVYCSQTLSKRLKVPRLDYVDTVECAMSVGPVRLREYTKIGRSLAAVFLCVANIGYCIFYISISAIYLKQILPIYFQGVLSIRMYVLIVAFLMIPVCLTTNLKWLASVSTLANLTNAVCLIIAFQYILSDLPGLDERPWFSGYSNDSGAFLLYVSDAMFSYEGIGTVLPIENRMINNHIFGGWNGMAAFGMLIVAFLYMNCGFFGFLKFGENARPSLILNLPTEQPLYQCVIGFNIFMVYCTTGLQLFAPAKTICNLVERNRSSGKSNRFVEYIVRFLILLFMTTFTLAVPNTELLLPFIGSLCGSAISFVIPPFLMVLILWIPDENLSRWKLIKHKLETIFYGVIFVLGFVFTVLCTIESTLNIYRYYLV